MASSDGYLANALTIGRIILSLALLAPAAFSPIFFALYVCAGATDALDGYVARKTETESACGARLDSVADCMLTAVCLAKVVPAISAPAWLWVWIAAIAAVRMTNVVSGCVMERHLVMLHTPANRVAGLMVFLVPLAMPLLGVVVPAVPACIVASFAAVQEGHLIRTGKEQPQ